MRIGIIGYGTVGHAVHKGLRTMGHEMSIHDPKLNTDIRNVIDSDTVFICVPTDQLPDGRCDTSIVENVISDLVDLGYQGIISIKSTVVPGTTQRLSEQYPDHRICFVPEFLKEKSADVDFMDNMDVLVIGANDRDTYDIIVSMHKHIPHSVADMITPLEAEIVKYFCNVYNALRITFASGVYEVCEKMGADYQKIFSACIKRNNIDSQYLKSGPSYKGFGGHCLPKDSMSFSRLVKDLGLELTLFDSIVKDNETHTREENK